MSTTSLYTTHHNTTGTTKSFQAFKPVHGITGSPNEYEHTDQVPGIPRQGNSSAEGFPYVVLLRDFMTSATIGTCLCLLAIIVNLLLMVSFFRSKKLRKNYIYIQVLSIAIADLSFVIMVDSFTIYYDVNIWRLGAAFCKTWMVLDGALAAVSLNGLVLLNVDRVLYTYCTRFYLNLVRSISVRTVLILIPWVLSSAIVIPIWLGFPAVEPSEGICVYGITKDANTVYTWLTIFIPSIAILILLIFVFIAVIGEMPTVTSLSTRPNGFHGTHTPMQMVDASQNSGPRNGELLSRRPEYEMTTSVTTVAVPPDDHRQRRFVASLLAVDFLSLATILPFPAFSMVNPDCHDSQSCASLRALFQTLMWVRSSVTFIRPLIFFLFTDLFRAFRYLIASCCFGRIGASSSPHSSYTSDRRNSREAVVDVRQELVTFAHAATPRVDSYRSRDDSVTNCTIITPPESPYMTQNLNILNQKSGKYDFRVETLFQEQDGTSV